MDVLEAEGGYTVERAREVCRGHGGDALPRLALRPKEAAKALGIGERLLWSMTNRGEIPHIKLGKAILYPIAELERWLSEQAQRKGGNRR